MQNDNSFSETPTFYNTPLSQRVFAQFGNSRIARSLNRNGHHNGTLALFNRWSQLIVLGFNVGLTLRSCRPRAAFFHASLRWSVQPLVLPVETPLLEQI